jgi:hypothetical protein
MYENERIQKEISRKEVTMKIECIIIYAERQGAFVDAVKCIEGGKKQFSF